MVQDYAGVTVATIANASMLDGRAIDATGEALYHFADAEVRRKIIVWFFRCSFPIVSGDWYNHFNDSENQEDQG